MVLQKSQNSEIVDHQYRALFEAANDAIFLMDGEKFLECNSKTFETFGCDSKEEIIGRSPWDFSPPQQPDGNASRDKGSVYIRDALNGIPQRFYWQHVRPDGIFFDAEVSLTRIEINGKPCLLAIVRDITEQKNAEQALRSAMQTASDIVHAIPAGLFIYQYQAPDRLVLLQGNPAAERLTDLVIHECIGKEFNDIWPEARDRGITDNFLNVMRTGLPYLTDDLYYRDERMEGAFAVSAFALPGDRLAISFENITERKRGEQALQEREKRLRSIFRVAPTGIGVVRDRVLLEVNDRFCEMLGRDREELIRKSARICYPTDEEYEYVGREKYAQIRSQGTGTVETRMLHRDGRILDVILSSTPIDRSDPSQGMIFSAQDVTELRRAQQMFSSIVKGTAAVTGTGFFRSLVRHLAQALDFRYAYIGEVTDSPPTEARTLAFWNGERILKNYRFQLVGTPCENVLGKRMCVFKSGVRQRFPNDQRLLDLSIESYIGTPLFSSAGEPLGILAVLDTRPFSQDSVDQATSLLSIFAARAAAELERVRAESALTDTAEKLELERQTLAEKNIALKEVLEHLEQEKVTFREDLTASIKRQIDPFIKKLRQSGGVLKPTDINLLEDTLNSAVGKEIDQFRNNMTTLTPRELDVCELIQAGRSSKEIAERLNLSLQTIHTHRSAIRRKLRLKGKGINLSAYLRSRS